MRHKYHNSRVSGPWGGNPYYHSDRIVQTYLTAAAITGGEVLIGMDIDHIYPVVAKLRIRPLLNPSGQLYL